VTTVDELVVIQEDLSQTSFYKSDIQRHWSKRAITSKIKRAIKHTIKLKTSPARLAHLLLPSLAFCFSLQPMTAHRQCKLKQNANEGCNSCASLAVLLRFYYLFYL